MQGGLPARRVQLWAGPSTLLSWNYSCRRGSAMSGTCKGRSARYLSLLGNAALVDKSDTWFPMLQVGLGGIRRFNFGRLTARAAAASNFRLARNRCGPAMRRQCCRRILGRLRKPAGTSPATADPSAFPGPRPRRTPTCSRLPGAPRRSPAPSERLSRPAGYAVAVPRRPPL